MNSMVFFLALAPAGLAALWLLSWFMRLEREGRGVTVVLFVLSLVLVEVVLFSDQTLIPTGLFHPGTGGDLSFRLYELLIPVALLARVLAKGAPERLGLASVVWVAFFVWFAAEAVFGYLRGNDLQNVLFHAKAIVYVGGGMVLTAGVPIGDYVCPGLRRLITGASVVALVMMLLTQAGIGIPVLIPGIAAGRAGFLGGDSASVLGSLGLLALGIGICSNNGRLGWLLPAGPLLACTLFAGQRAAMLATAASLVLVVLAVIGRSGRKRTKVTPTELGLVVLGLVGMMLASTFFTATKADATPKTPLGDAFQEVFFSTGKKQSAQDRVNQFRVIKTLIGEHPILGWGLAKRFSYYRVGPKEFEEVYATHNIGTDLLLRMGIVGLLLFLAAIVATIVQGLRAWRVLENDVLAGLTLALLAAVVGLLSKGLVESIFEKYRLAVLFGLLLGMLRSAVTTSRHEELLHQLAGSSREERAVWN